MHPRHLGILQLHLGLLQPLLDRVLLLGAAAAQAALELLLGRRRDEDVPGGEARRLDLLDALDLDVQDYRLALGSLLLDGRFGGAVEVVAELRAVVLGGGVLAGCSFSVVRFIQGVGTGGEGRGGRTSRRSRRWP